MKMGESSEEKALRNKERITIVVKGVRGFIFLGLVLVWAATALAQDVVLELSLPRESLDVLLQALDGTTISYQGKNQEDLRAGKLFIRRTRITRMGEGQIQMDLDGTMWIHYFMGPKQGLGLLLEKPMEIKTNVDFSSLLSLIPQVDQLSKKLILKANVLTLDLKKAEGVYDLLIQVPGVDQIIRSEINKALQGMNQEILDLSPYMVPQERLMEESRWKADRTLWMEPREVKIEVRPDALKVRASARVDSKTIDQRKK